MRYWQFGIFDAQQADFDGMFCMSARSILSFAANAVNTESSVNNFNPTGVSGNAIAGYEDDVAEPTHNIGLIEVAIGQIKAKVGQVPILVKVDLGMCPESTKTTQLRVYRMYSTWDDGDTTTRYKDVSLSTTWYEDTYGPYPGQDRSVAAEYAGPIAEQLTIYVRVYMTITSIVESALRDNDPIRFMLWHKGADGPSEWCWKHPVTTNRPTLEFYYVYPVEFYRDDGAGDLDLTSPVSDNPGDEYYLGAAEPGSTGSAVKCHIRNYSGSVKQIEVLDDHPEYTTPISRIGSGQLDFVTLADNAVSQKYTCIFYSATQYEVLAEAYKDNPISLHPQIDADASWRGTVGGDFTAPEGGLSIPAIAWQPGTSSADEYETGVRGQTTDSAWAADANDQIEITFDDAGTADATAWRPCIGHRELTTAQTTIDSTTKLIPTRMIDPVDWPVATKAFIMDASNINEGAIASVQEADIGAPAHSGTGPDDITISGNFNGTWSDTLRIKIDGTGSPDTFTWSIDGGSTWEATGVNCSTTDILLQDGIYVKWTSATGHTLNDYWDSVVASWAIELSGLTANSNVYNSGSRIGTTLPLRDVTAATFTDVDAASGVSQGAPARLYLTSTAGFNIGDDVFVQTPGDPDNWEIREVDSVLAGQYVDMTVAFTLDFAIGDFVTVVGTGQAIFWSRPNAVAITNEERKDLRFNARML